MHTVTARLDDDLFRATQENAKKCHKPLSSYIRDALLLYNNTQMQKRLYNSLQKASLEVRDESIKINAEFSAIEGELND